MKKTIMLILVAVLAAGILAGCDSNKRPYAEAEELLSNKQYAEAADVFNALGDYMDAVERADEARYMIADTLFGSGRYTEAADAFIAMGGYMDAPARADEARYRDAEILFDSTQYPEAATAFNALGNYKDSQTRAKEAENENDYLAAGEYIDEQEYQKAKEILTGILDYKDSEEIYNGLIYDEAMRLINTRRYKEASEVFSGIAGFRDADSKIELCDKNIRYAEALSSFNDGMLEPAYQQFSDLAAFIDSDKYVSYIEAGMDAEEENYVDAMSKYLLLGSFLNSKDLYSKYEYLYYDQQYQSGIRDLSALPQFPLQETSPDLNRWRRNRVAALQNEIDSSGLADYYAKTDASLSPVEVTGFGIYVNNSDRRYEIGELIDQVVKDVPVFFLADSLDKVRYVMNFTSRSSYAGTYTDGATGYAVTTVVTIKDTVTGRIEFSKSYYAPVPYIKYGSGDAYGSHFFMGVPDEYSDYPNYSDYSDYGRDILPALKKLYE